MLEHGGNRRAASVRYGIAEAAWLDLSTGINPAPYPVPPAASEDWGRLPQEEDGLEQAAADYYGTTDLLAVAGSQAAIQALPRLRAPGRAGVLYPGYAEHARAWHAAGHDVVPLTAEQINARLDNLSALVLMHPNNPNGARFSRDALRDWHGRLAARGGWLVVDEAFIDPAPAASLAQADMPPGLIVLRSLGKFFGLAGARVGFMLAAAPLRLALRELLGPWTVAGPSRRAAEAALRDRAWQVATRQRLLADSVRLAGLLRAAGLPPAGGCALFQWVVTGEAEGLHRRLAEAAILTRWFPETGSVRFGLPGTEADWQRLEQALQE
ncbi:MAG TPA: threonine-phosphate decarboxylase CobD [Gallionellaceae bacterium]|nr:threonine-phosphate decarboxylase CobD [Gallionellaceae bacterium]